MNPVAAPIPAAAGTPAARLLRGDVRTGRVLAVFSSALVISVSGIAVPGLTGDRQLSLLTRTASGVPNGVRLPSDFDAGRLRDCAAGDPATVGGGRLRVGPLDIVIVREWTSLVRSGQLGPAAPRDLVAALAGRQVGVESSRVAALGAALDSPGPGLADAVRGLVGVGSGLTPGGDDVLSGAAAGLLATGRGDLVAQIAAAVPWARTNAVSAELLRLALSGHASTEILAVLRQLMTTRPTPGPAGAITHLLEVGHTSGADLATGLLLGLTRRPLLSAR